VLSRFHPDERKDIEEAEAKCVAAVELWLREGFDAASRVANAGEPGA